MKKYEGIIMKNYVENMKIFLHIFFTFLLRIFPHIPSYFPHIPSYFPHISSPSPIDRGGGECTRGFPIVARGPGLKICPSPPDIFSKAIPPNMTSSTGVGEGEALGFVKIPISPPLYRLWNFEKFRASPSI